MTLINANRLLMVLAVGIFILSCLPMHAENSGSVETAPSTAQTSPLADTGNQAAFRLGFWSIGGFFAVCGLILIFRPVKPSDLAR